MNNENCKSYSQMRRDFCEKFRREILPIVNAFEDERKKKLKKAIFVSIGYSILGIIILLFLYINSDKLSSKSADNVFKLAIIAFAAAISSWFMIKKGFENKIKTKIMPTVCSCFSNLQWYSENFNNSDVFVKSGVISQYTGERFDDIFRGSYKEVDFEIIEACYDVGSGRNRQIVFNGAVVRIEMNKFFKSHTVIAPDGLLHKSPVKGLSHTVLEDVAFEKNFDVFTNDEVDARYLITPTFMERIKNLELAFKADKIKCAFYNKWLIIALSTKKDLFSICSLTKPICDNNQYFQMYEEIESIIKLIDYFKLDQKIGL